MADTPAPPQTPLKILVVEDSPTQLEELRFLLEESGFSVVAATNGKQGLAAAKANSIDLVISDIVMPEMDGYALCKALRAEQTLRHLPVILLTSLTDPRDVIQGLESGANNFICKPYDDRALLARVQNVVANQEIRKTASSEMGISVFFGGQRFFITADRLQILDLLLSTYENAVSHNRELIRTRDELRVLNDQLEARVAERTAALTAEVEERKRAEARVAEQNATLNAILESVDHPVFSLDRQYRYKSFNRAHAAVMKAIYGTDIQIGHSLAEYQTIPEDWAIARANLDRALQGETLFESAYSGAQGLSRRHFEVTHYPIRTDTEEIIGVSVFARDITERERAEEQAAAVLRTAMDGFYVTDTEGRILEVNDAYCRLSGHSRDELLAMRVVDLEALETPEDFARHARRIMEVGEDRFETRHRRKDGRTFDLEASVKYLKDAGRLIAFMRDITERKQVQQALEASEARFRAVVASAPAAIVVAQAGRIVLWNQGAERLFGYSGGEALGQPVTMLMPEPDLTQHREAVQRFHASGEERLASKSYEARALRKDGSQCPVQISLAVWQSPQGAFTSAIITDITERKRAEQALLAAEERYRMLFERNLAGVFRSKCDGRILECNEAFAQIYGYGSREEILSHSAVDLYPDPEARASFIDRIERERTLLTFESQGRRKDGSPVWIVENTSLVDSEDGDSCLEGTIIDMTGRKRLEEQLAQAQKMEAVGQLAGGVAHDFNNLLGIITGYSELALKDLGLQHPAHRRLGQILKAAERAAALTRQLLAFSRKQVVQPKVLDLNAIVADIEKMLRRLIGEDVQLVTVLTEDVGRVKADPGQIEQVIVNLAVNARDAMPGGGRLIIETGNAALDEAYTRSHAEVSPGPHVMLAVTDTGCGMDAPTIARIFEPFFTTKEPGKGTGLGLATVYGIVKQSGGHVNVYSEVGRGSTFKVYLPRVDAEALPPEGTGAPAAAASGSETILLVEDDADLRGVIREMLESAGYAVLETGDPERALEMVAARAEPLHLIITDVVMPRMSGPELGRRVASVRAETRVLYMSGYTERAGSVALEAGEHFIQKPFAAEALLRRVREILDAPE